MKTLVKIGEMMQFLPAVVKDAVHHAAKVAGKKTDDLDLKRAGYSEKAKTNQLDGKSRKALKYVSTRTLDRDGDVLIPEGMDLTEFVKYGHVLVNHNYSLLPVGSDESIEADTYGIKAMTEYADTGEGTLANVVWHLVSQGHMKASSVGFVPIECIAPGDAGWDRACNKLASDWPEFSKDNKALRRVVSKGILLEHSDVSVPCNADAEIISVVKSLKVDAQLAKQLGISIVNKDGLALVTLTTDDFQALPEWPEQKPYPNEHAARIHEPGRYRQMRRENGKFGEGIDVIWGVTEDGKTEIQAVRFNKDKFTMEQVRAWLKDHDMKPVEVEPASDGKSSEVVPPKSEEEKPDAVVQALIAEGHTEESAKAIAGQAKTKDLPAGMIVAKYVKGEEEDADVCIAQFSAALIDTQMLVEGMDAAYILCHHTESGAVSKSALKVAMAEALGARGKYMDIPRDRLALAYAHLKAHAADLGLTALDWGRYTQSELKRACPEAFPVEQKSTEPERFVRVVAPPEPTPEQIVQKAVEAAMRKARGQV